MTEPPMTHPPAAWHPDPADPRRLRWWDGRQWTGHVLPAPGQRPTTTYRPARSLGIASIVLVLLVVAMEIVLTMVSIPSYSQISNAMSEGHDRADVFTPYDAVILLQALVEIAAYVVVCLWLWRARANAEALEPAAPHARGRGWVWGSWICPVVNLWFPYLVVRDVARATRSDAGVGRWWAAFVVWMLCSNLFLRFALDGLVPVLQGVSLLASIVAARWWIATVRGITRDQRTYADGKGS